jgi:glycosyltransferase involved in cell wall biosynthesis
MKILFVHQNYPAQFGHVARYLIDKHGHECVFVSQKPGKHEPGLHRVQYRLAGKPRSGGHPAARVFEETLWHCQAVHDALEPLTDLVPDLIVGHSGFGSTLYLRDLFDCPVLNYFEYFYPAHESDADYRPDFPTGQRAALRSRSRNAMILLDLENCDRGYSPTHWQHARLPEAYRPRVEVHFDGIDLDIWKRSTGPRRIGNWEVPAGCKLVTYATRGMESMRGFDIFLAMAHRLCRLRPDVVFAIAGEDRICYGGDKKVTGGRSFKEHLFALGHLDTSRFHFLGLLPPAELAKLFSFTDLHVYLTVPFVLSWSLFNALACEAVVLASATDPVREVIEHERTGLLVPFFDVEGFVEQAVRVLADPPRYRPLGVAGRALMAERYAHEVCLPRLARLYEETARAGTTPRALLPWFGKL